MLKLHFDLMLILSVNLVNLMGYEEAILENASDHDMEVMTRDEVIKRWQKKVRFMKTQYISSRQCFFLEKKDQKFYFVLFDKIDTFVVTHDGCRLPILFEYDVTRDNDRKGKYLCSKKIIGNNLSEFRFGLLRSDSSVFMRDFDLKKYPLEVTFVVFY